MSAYVTSRSLARAARRRPHPLGMVPQTTNPSRFWQWLTIGLNFVRACYRSAERKRAWLGPRLIAAFWLLVFASTAVLGAMVLMVLFFGIE